MIAFPILFSNYSARDIVLFGFVEGLMEGSVISGLGLTRYQPIITTMRIACIANSILFTVFAPRPSPINQKENLCKRAYVYGYVSLLTETIQLIFIQRLDIIPYKYLALIGINSLWNLADMFIFAKSLNKSNLT